MKKVLFFIFLFIINFSLVKAEKLEVTLDKCVDGDTAYFYLDKEQIKTRFLAIDTPESTNEIEPYGKEASNFTCDKLKQAKKIEIEYDSKSDKTDKYDRHLVWVFVDDYLLQDLIIKEGLAEVAYLYGDYKYVDTLKDHQEVAKINKLNMWSETETKSTWYYVFWLMIIIILCVFSKKYRNKVIKKVKKEIKI